MKHAVVLSAFLLSGFAGTAGAQPADPGAACRADAQKFCKDVKPGGGRIVQCLAQHESELSAPCRKRMAEGKQRVEEFAEACKADAAKVCKDVQPGEGRVVRCLVERKDQLSPACRQRIVEGEQAHPCHADAIRLCKGVQPGEGRIAECMKRNEGKLSPACKARIGEYREQGKKDRK